eukprot:4057415-Prymnesium_polylepis.1
MVSSSGGSSPASSRPCEDGEGGGGVGEVEGVHWTWGEEAALGRNGGEKGVQCVRAPVRPLRTPARCRAQSSS